MTGRCRGPRRPGDPPEAPRSVAAGGEDGPYDGIVARDVSRVGRNVRDTLNTQAMLTDQGKAIVTADHAGVWDFTHRGPGK